MYIFHWILFIVQYSTLSSNLQQIIEAFAILKSLMKKAWYTRADHHGFFICILELLDLLDVQ